MPVCWCGNSQKFAPFDDDFARCQVCNTLVLCNPPTLEDLNADDEENYFYGRKYWLSHQPDTFDYPDIYKRSRLDLSERALYWLRALLEYRLPPANVLELGAAHGGFVWLMRSTGFDATGLEMDAWVVAYARQTFQVPMLLGPIEEQTLAEKSLDVIVLMDVLEHLPDPVGTMDHCLHLLKPDGLLLIQTPEYTGKTREGMRAENKNFEAHLKAKEHLFLFTQESLAELFAGLGAHHITFLPPIFAYDMFCVVSRMPLTPFSLIERDTALLHMGTIHHVLTLLDMQQQVEQLTNERNEFAIAARDRLAALEQQEKEYDQLHQQLGQQHDQIETLQNQSQLQQDALDDRLVVIQHQSFQIEELQDQHQIQQTQLEARLNLINRQAAQIQQLEQQVLDQKTDLDARLAALQQADVTIQQQTEHIQHLTVQIREQAQYLSDQIHTQQEQLAERLTLIQQSDTIIRQQTEHIQNLEKQLVLIEQQAARIQTLEQQIVEQQTHLDERLILLQRANTTLQQQTEHIAVAEQQLVQHQQIIAQQCTSITRLTEEAQTLITDIRAQEQLIDELKAVIDTQREDIFYAERLVGIMKKRMNETG